MPRNGEGLCGAIIKNKQWQLSLLFLLIITKVKYIFTLICLMFSKIYK